MRTRSVTPIPSHIVEELTADLAEWRKTNRPPTPLPSHVWSRATTLANQYGARNTARTLGLGYSTLLKRVASTKPATSLPATGTGAFVEWLPGPVDTITECTLEVSAGQRQLRVGMQYVSASAVATIVREFCK